MSGTILLPKGSARTYTLPAATSSSGVHFTFIAGSAHAHQIRTDGGVLTELQGQIFHASNSTDTNLKRVLVSNGKTITMNIPTIGDRIELICDGANWIVTGWVNAEPIIEY